MSYYRINANLTTKHKINTISNLNFSQETIDKLLSIGAISEISIPPLKFLPMWELRAEKLEAIGITEGLEFLNTADYELASKLGKTVEFVQQWKTDLISDLIVKFDEKCCGR